MSAMIESETVQLFKVSRRWDKEQKNISAKEKVKL